MILTVGKKYVKEIFEQNGYKVLYLDFLWNSLDDPTVYPECYKNNVYLQTNCGGAWRVVLLNPNLLNEMDYPYIFCNLYDLKTQFEPNCPKHHQEKIESFWFEYVNRLAQAKYIMPDISTQKGREYVLQQSNIFYETFSPHFTPNTIQHVEIKKPLAFDPKNCIKAQFDLAKRFKEAEAEAGQTK